MARPKLLTKEQVIDALSRWFIRNSVPPTSRSYAGFSASAPPARFSDTSMRSKRKATSTGGPERGDLGCVRAGSRSLETRLVPIVGEAPAGQLMPAEENILGQVQIPKEFLKPPSAKFFLLRVRGDSMNRAKVEGQTIEDGDLVLVRQQDRVDPGKIVVALVDGEATIKKLVKGPATTSCSRSPPTRKTGLSS